MTVPQPIAAPFKGIHLTWEQDGPVPIIRKDRVLQALGISQSTFDAVTNGYSDRPDWGDDFYEYDSLYECMLLVEGSEALRLHMFGF